MSVPGQFQILPEAEEWQMEDQAGDHDEHHRTLDVRGQEHGIMAVTGAQHPRSAQVCVIHMSLVMH